VRVLTAACLVSGAVASLLGIVVLTSAPPEPDPLDALVASLDPRFP
jgi:hypothetical protein